MAKQFIQAVNTGTGFITHEDQEVEGLSFTMVANDLWQVDGSTQSINTWKSRVSGTKLTAAKAKPLIDEFNKQAKPSIGV